MKILIKIALTSIIIYFPIISQVMAAGLFGSEETLWESANQYIKLTPQDELKSGKTPPNEHPVDLDSNAIADALKSLQYWDKGFFKKKELGKVFTFSQATTLGNQLSSALKKAKPDQDVTFALVKLEAIALGVKDRLYSAGRIFYSNGKLHIIMGDFNRPPDRGKESVEKSWSIDDHYYYFSTGSRSSIRNKNMFFVVGEGVEIFEHQGSKARRDWAVIDIKEAAIAYNNRAKKKVDKKDQVNTEAIEREAALIARERREMRAEMARMRKEMKEMNGAGSESQTIEERIQKLDELLDKNLITKDEYNNKRQEILNDI